MRAVCAAITRKDVAELLGLFSKDATLTWGPYEFKGYENIERWASEFEEVFPNVAFKERSLSVQGEKASATFDMQVAMPDGRRGMLPITAECDYRDGKIHTLRVSVGFGYLVSRA